MFSKHVSKELSAYCHGEVRPQDSKRIAEHLISCQRCRAEYEEVKLGIRFAEKLPQLEAPDSLWDALELQLDQQTGHPQLTVVKAESRAAFIRRPQLAAIAAGLILALGLGAIWLYRQESRASWEVARLDGSPRIGSTRINDKSRLAIGQWLETDDVSRAKINVSSIGAVEVDPNTRVRLL
ncbi:MAG: anti-sigma factor family protein, partial [Pyrinomonadaceae bacterium]